MAPGTRSVRDYNAPRARGTAINEVHRPLPRFNGIGPACGVHTTPTLAESNIDAPLVPSTSQYGATTRSACIRHFPLSTPCRTLPIAILPPATLPTSPSARRTTNDDLTTSLTRLVPFATRRPWTIQMTTRRPTPPDATLSTATVYARMCTSSRLAAGLSAIQFEGKATHHKEDYATVFKVQAKQPRAAPSKETEDLVFAFAQANLMRSSLLLPDAAFPNTLEPDEHGHCIAMLQDSQAALEDLAERVKVAEQDKSILIGKIKSLIEDVSRLSANATFSAKQTFQHQIHQLVMAQDILGSSSRIATTSRACTFSSATTGNSSTSFSSMAEQSEPDGFGTMYTY
ncbi:hypothetical protein IWX90DRAFT_410891 [Phyllosticta citrichinensis]|uniref:Uncharacterized protein n=1 Tax=Phyllosticta citrichinensis TaxID=1130410 RepID=A0ABR1Y6B2_9PEZI